MRIGEIERRLSGRTGVTDGQAASAPDASKNRALVALAPPAPAREAVARHRQAPFLAQFLAV
jgi:hypothetical protein